MTKSKMRIYKDNHYSDYTVYMDLTIDLEDNHGLWIDTPNESIRLEVDDLLKALRPRIISLMETLLQ